MIMINELFANLFHDHRSFLEIERKFNEEESMHAVHIVAEQDCLSLWQVGANGLRSAVVSCLHSANCIQGAEAGGQHLS